MNRRTARLIVFALALLLGVTAGVAQRRAQRHGRADFLTEWTGLLARPFLTTAQAVGGKGRSIARVFRTNSSLRRSNAALLSRNASLRSRLHQNSEAVSELRRLQALLSLKEELPLTTTSARVLIRPATPWAHTCTISRGSSDGVRLGSAVLAADGLVGQVMTVQPRTSQVQLLRDQNSSVASLTQRSRAPGICSGDGGEVLSMVYIPLTADVRTGDIVLSSGEGGVFPKGVIVGTVVSVGAPEHDHFKSAIVRPAVEPRSLEDVLVVVDRT